MQRARAAAAGKGGARVRANDQRSRRRQAKSQTRGCTAPSASPLHDAPADKKARRGEAPKHRSPVARCTVGGCDRREQGRGSRGGGPPTDRCRAGPRQRRRAPVARAAARPQEGSPISIKTRGSAERQNPIKDGIERQRGLNPTEQGATFSAYSDSEPPTDKLNATGAGEHSAARSARTRDAPKRNQHAVAAT